MFSPKYTAEGENALVDGFMGSDNFADGFWQGCESDDLEAVVDIGMLKIFLP